MTARDLMCEVSNFKSKFGNWPGLTPIIDVRLQGILFNDLASHHPVRTYLKCDSDQLTRHPWEHFHAWITHGNPKK